MQDRTNSIGASRRPSWFAWDQDGRANHGELSRVMDGQSTPLPHEPVLSGFAPTQLTVQRQLNLAPSQLHDCGSFKRDLWGRAVGAHHEVFNLNPVSRYRI